jgi:isochorismate synthase
MPNREAVRDFNVLLKKNVPFAFWRLPDKPDIYRMPTGTYRFVFMEEALTKPGFVFAPFHENYFIYLSILDRLSDYQYQALPDKPIKIPPLAPQYSTEFSEYSRAFGDMMKFLRKGPLQKVVLARQIRTELVSYKNAANYFLALTEAYPKAFVFAVFVPGSGLWIGATPEILLRHHPDGYYEVFSMAGTRRADSFYPWTDKERQEQAIVTTGVREALKNAGINDFQVHGPVEYHTAGLIHLKTVFQIPETISIEVLAELIDLLHPTPAVGGYPQMLAKDVIRDYEPGNRDFYTGYLGSTIDYKKPQLFVNLRSMQVFPDYSIVYVGGGLTLGSVLEDEWQETENKSRTLLSVAEVMNYEKHQ